MYPVFEEWFMPEFNLLQMLGLAFVLGSLYIATISDLKYMRVVHENITGWSIIIALLACIDIYSHYTTYSGMQILAVKWLLIGVLCLLSTSRFGVLFKLAKADVVAIAAACALLEPATVVLFFVLLKVLDKLEEPLLRRAGDRSGYPFLPVVFSATLVMLAFALVWEGWVRFW